MLDRWLRGGVTQSDLARDLGVGRTLSARRGWVSRLLESERAAAYMRRVADERDAALAVAHRRAALEAVGTEDTVLRELMDIVTDVEQRVADRVSAGAAAARIAAERLKRIMAQRVEVSGPAGGPVETQIQVVWSDELAAACAEGGDV